MTPDHTAPTFTSQVWVALSLEMDNFQEAMSEAGSHMDDLYWAYHVTRPFSWQRWIDWWAARRWIQPRDVRKR